MSLGDQFDMSHTVGHVTSAGAIVFSWSAVFAGVAVPAVACLASLAALAWYLTQLYEGHTVQNWLARRNQRKMAKLTLKLARLSAKELIVNTEIATRGEREFTSNPQPLPSSDVAASAPTNTH